MFYTSSSVYTNKYIWYVCVCGGAEGRRRVSYDQLDKELKSLSLDDEGDIVLF